MTEKDSSNSPPPVDDDLDEVAAAKLRAVGDNPGLRAALADLQKQNASGQAFEELGEEDVPPPRPAEPSERQEMASLTVPKPTKFKTIEIDTVKVSPAVDPRRMATQPSITTRVRSQGDITMPSIRKVQALSASAGEVDPLAPAPTMGGHTVRLRGGPEKSEPPAEAPPEPVESRKWPIWVGALGLAAVILVVVLSTKSGGGNTPSASAAATTPAPTVRAADTVAAPSAPEAPSAVPSVSATAVESPSASPRVPPTAQPRFPRTSEPATSPSVAPVVQPPIPVKATATPAPTFAPPFEVPGETKSK